MCHFSKICQCDHRLVFGAPRPFSSNGHQVREGGKSSSQLGGTGVAWGHGWANLWLRRQSGQQHCSLLTLEAKAGRGGKEILKDVATRRTISRGLASLAAFIGQGDGRSPSAIRQQSWSSAPLVGFPRRADRRDRTRSGAPWADPGEF